MRGHREQLQTHHGPRVAAHPGPRHRPGPDHRGRGAQNASGGTVRSDVDRFDAVPARDQTDQPVLPVVPGAAELQAAAAAATQADQPQTHRESGPRPGLGGAAEPVQPLFGLGFTWTSTFDMHVCVSPSFIVQVMRSYCR